MKKEIHCPKDGTLLVTFESAPTGGTVMSFPEGGGKAIPKPATTPGYTELWFICPKCGTETFAAATGQPS